MPGQVELVHASGSGGSEPKVLRFGPLDTLYIQMQLVVDIGLTYEGVVNPTRLKQAISASLVEFWPCSGRLRRTEQGDEVVIEGCDAGVWFSHQTIDDSTLPLPEYPLDVKVESQQSSHVFAVHTIRDLHSAATASSSTGFRSQCLTLSSLIVNARCFL